MDDSVESVQLEPVEINVDDVVDLTGGDVVDLTGEDTEPIAARPESPETQAIREHYEEEDERDRLQQEHLDDELVRQAGEIEYHAGVAEELQEIQEVEEILDLALNAPHVLVNLRDAVQEFLDDPEVPEEEEEEDVNGAIDRFHHP